MPLSYSFGAQVDGLVGELGGDDARGAALHLFWRDPSMGMAGLVFSRVELDSAMLTRAGMEGEVYSGDWTFGGQIGWQGGDVAEEAYASLGAVRYMGDGMRLDFTVEGVGERMTARMGAEWALGNSRSLRVAALGSEDEAMLSVGLQVTFGGSAAGLKARDRRDDPANGLLQTLVGQRSLLRLSAHCSVDNCSGRDHAGTVNNGGGRDDSGTANNVDGRDDAGTANNGGGRDDTGIGTNCPEIGDAGDDDCNGSTL